MSKSNYLFFGTINKVGVTGGSGLQEWAVENVFKQKSIVEDDSSFSNFGPPACFIKCFFPCFFTPFILIYVFLFIAPWLLFQAPIACAGTYPFAFLWMSMLTFMFAGNQFGKKYLSL